MSLNHRADKRAWWTIVFFIVWALVLLVLMTIPMTDNAAPSVGILRYWDKMAHVFLFGVTGCISVYGARFLRRFGSRLAFGLIFSLFLAFGTESVQAFLNYRTADVYDLMADLLGIFMGLFIYLVAYLHEGLRTHLRL